MKNNKTTKYDYKIKTINGLQTFVFVITSFILIVYLLITLIDFV